MSKYEAVCAALRDGVTRPADGVVHAKERYGVEMTPNQFSAHKSRAVLEKVIPEQSPAEPPKQPETAAPEPKAVQQDAPKPVAKEPPAPKAQVKAPPAPKTEPVPAPKSKPAAASGGSPADLARQVKQLVARHGADAVADMLDVFKE